MKSYEDLTVGQAK